MLESFKCLNGKVVAAGNVQAARLSAKALKTKLLRDATKQERDSYLYRFTNQHRGACNACYRKVYGSGTVTPR